MPFAVEDFRDLLRLLDEHPDWRRELRRVVLTDELLALPTIIHDLAEAQRRTEERLEVLTARVDTLTEHLDTLTARVDTLTERLDTLTARVDTLTERLDTLTARVDALTERLDTLTARVDALTERVDTLTMHMDQLAQTVSGLVQDVGRLKGSDLERQFREKAHAWLGRQLRRVRVLDRHVLGDLLDDAVDAGRLTEDERTDVLRVDAVVRGRDTEGELLVAVEVSWTVDDQDVERAVRRARALAKTGARVQPAVAGREWVSGIRETAERSGVLILMDG